MDVGGCARFADCHDRELGVSHIFLGDIFYFYYLGPSLTISCRSICLQGFMVRNVTFKYHLESQHVPFSLYTAPIHIQIS